MISSLKFDPRVIAHRGASGYAPENTMSAFTKAAQSGIGWVEFDVTLSADQVPVIFHDETLERTTDGHGLLAQYPFHYLQTLDAGRWFNSAFSGERIPTLKQVLDFLASVKMKANIEMKSSQKDEAQLVQAIVADLAPYMAKDPTQFLFSSFSLTALKYLRQYSPDYLLGLLIHDWDDFNWQQHCQLLDCVSVHVNHEIMTKEWALEIKAMHKTLLCYTVNTTKRAKELYDIGVDAVFSDVPDQIAKMNYHF